MSARGVLLACALGTMIAGSQAADRSETDLAFEGIGASYLEDLLKSSPVAATGLGDHRYDHLLDDIGSESRNRRLESVRRFLGDLEKLEAGNLSAENQVDFYLLRHRLRKAVWQIEEHREWEWNPLVYNGVAGGSIYGLLAREPDDLEARLEAAGARLREFPRFFEQVRRSLAPAKVPAIHAETAVDQNRGLTTLLQNVIGPRIAELSGERKRELEAAVGVAERAITEHQAWLEKELLPSAKGDPRLGAARYAEKFAHELFTSATPEELRTRSERALADFHDRMYEICLGIQADAPAPENPSPEQKRDLIRSTLESAYDDRPDRDGVVEAAEHSLEITTAFVRERDLITIPDDPLEIILMPEFRRGVSLAYCDAPGPLDVGEKTFYAVSPPPADWTEAQVDSLLREYNRRSIHNLTVHEAMPGHFVQLAHANRSASRLRSVLASGTFIEGWAVYCEWMMIEQGFLADDPLNKLIVLKWYLRDVTNALIDQMVHIDGIEEKEAVAFLMTQGFQEESEAVKKYRRALLTSGQLATYFTGYLEHVDLRRAVEEQRGDDFELKAYHDDVLSFGSPPVRYVRALMLDEAIPE